MVQRYNFLFLFTSLSWLNYPNIAKAAEVIDCRVFHSDLHERCFACCAEDSGDDVTCNLKNDFYGLTHNFSMF